MLVLKSLEVEGFGPFADAQRIDFGPASGVTVVYGDNMRGKTTLLNAIRFAFYGYVVGRMMVGDEPRRRRLRSIVNRDLAASGVFRFAVTLAFEFDGKPYELVRACEALTGDPQDDSDFDIETLVRSGGRTLGPQEKDHLLATVLPADIARFFLFDGELLQEYEQLLLAGSSDGKKISGAIERILGVPVLKQGHKHLKSMADEAVRTAGREAGKHKDTQAFGAALQLAADQKQAHVAELERLQGDQKAQQELKAEIEARLSAVQRLRQIVDQLAKARDKLAEAEKDQRDAGAELQQSMSAAWRTLLREPIRVARAAAQAAAQRQHDELIGALRRRAVDHSHCEVCDQAVPASLHTALLARAAEGDTSAAAQPLLTLKELNAIQDEDRTGEVRALWERLQSARVRAKTAQDEVDDCEESLKGGKGDDIAVTQAEYTKTLERLAALADAVGKAEGKVAEQDAAIAELNRKLRGAAGGDLGEAEARAALLADAAAVFGEAVERYKNELRTKVQATASDLFLAMTTETSDYVGLTINEAYGLTIRHRDGQAEEARSAGAEHVVALALMGALQRNAPLRGPIVMDSPFGRLDAGHTDKIVAALPTMADQTVLLVHENEVDRGRVRELLRGKLHREYALERISARRTHIRAVTQ